MPPYPTSVGIIISLSHAAAMSVLKRNRKHQCKVWSISHTKSPLITEFYITPEPTASLAPLSNRVYNRVPIHSPYIPIPLQLKSAQEIFALHASLLAKLPTKPTAEFLMSLNFQKIIVIKASQNSTANLEN